MAVRFLFLLCAVATLAAGTHAFTQRSLRTASTTAKNFEMHVGGVRVETNEVEVTSPTPPSGDESVSNGDDPVVIRVTFKRAFHEEPFVMLDLEHYVVEDGPSCWDYGLHNADNEGFDLHFAHPCGWNTYKATVRYTAIG